MNIPARFSCYSSLKNLQSYCNQLHPFAEKDDVKQTIRTLQEDMNWLQVDVDRCLTYDFNVRLLALSKVKLFEANSEADVIYQRLLLEYRMISLISKGKTVEEAITIVTNVVKEKNS